MQNPPMKTLLSMINKQGHVQSQYYPVLTPFPSLWSATLDLVASRTYPLRTKAGNAADQPSGYTLCLPLTSTDKQNRVRAVLRTVHAVTIGRFPELPVLHTELTHWPEMLPQTESIQLSHLEWGKGSLDWGNMSCLNTTQL